MTTINEADMAIVPFSYTSPFHAGHLDAERWFHLDDVSIHIKQAWKPDGRGGTDLGFGAHIRPFVPGLLLTSVSLITNPSIVRQRRVVELGCGTGLVAIAAARAGASEVVATDGDDQVVELAQHNIDINTPSQGDSTSFSCHAKKHFWGEDLDGLGHFDVIVGADIIACPYETAYDALLVSLRHLLSPPSSVALIAYKQRHGSETKFFFKLKREFSVEIVPKDDCHPDFRNEGIDILRLTKRVPSSQS